MEQQRERTLRCDVHVSAAPERHLHLSQGGNVIQVMSQSFFTNSQKAMASSNPAELEQLWDTLGQEEDLWPLRLIQVEKNLNLSVKDVICRGLRLPLGQEFRVRLFAEGGFRPCGDWALLPVQEKDMLSLVSDALKVSENVPLLERRIPSGSFFVVELVEENVQLAEAADVQRMVQAEMENPFSLSPLDLLKIFLHAVEDHHLTLCRASATPATPATVPAVIQSPQICKCDAHVLINWFGHIERSLECAKIRDTQVESSFERSGASPNAMVLSLKYKLPQVFRMRNLMEALIKSISEMCAIANIHANSRGPTMAVRDFWAGRMLHLSLCFLRYFANFLRDENVALCSLLLSCCEFDAASARNHFNVSMRCQGPDWDAISLTASQIIESLSRFSQPIDRRSPSVWRLKSTQREFLSVFGSTQPMAVIFAYTYNNTMPANSFSAALMCECLKRCGFRVKVYLNHDQMVQAVQTMDSVSPSPWAPTASDQTVLFFFNGHGCRAEGNTFMQTLPKCSSFNELVNMQTVLNLFVDKGYKNIVGVADACSVLNLGGNVVAVGPKVATGVKFLTVNAVHAGFEGYSMHFPRNFVAGAFRGETLVDLVQSMEEFGQRTSPEITMSGKFPKIYLWNKGKMV